MSTDWTAQALPKPDPNLAEAISRAGPDLCYSSAAIEALTTLGGLNVSASLWSAAGETML